MFDRSTLGLHILLRPIDFYHIFTSLFNLILQPFMYDFVLHKTAFLVLKHKIPNKH